jgi:hypothetical protein
MSRSILDETSGYFAPDTLKVLCTAFDEVWQDIGGNYGHLTADEKRRRLALVILELGNNGARDLEDIKETALEIMRLKERPDKFNGWSTSG